MVVVQLLADVAPDGVQEDTAVGPVATEVQMVDVKLLPALAVAGVQLLTNVGPVVTGAGQVVVVQLLAGVAADAVQVTTGTFAVLFVLQVEVV